MSDKYGFLIHYINNNDVIGPRNYFDKVNKTEIEDAEERLGYQFPEQLKQFWLEIGCGFLKKSHDSIGLSTYDHINRIMAPDDIANIILLPEDNELKSELILPWAAEYLEPDDMPFFEIGDLSDFLFMRPLSDDPNAIYSLSGRKIEKDFETFIHNLYYKAPTFYLNQSESTKPEVKPTEEELLCGTPARGLLWQYVNHNYHKTFRELGIYEKYRYGGEPAALEMVKKFDIFVNKCPDCGNIKATPRARQCLECMKFNDPVY